MNATIPYSQPTPQYFISYLSNMFPNSGYNMTLSGARNRVVIQRCGAALSSDKGILLSNTAKNVFISTGENSSFGLYANSFRVLSEIEQLPENWNENGAPSFSKEMIDIMRKIILTLDNQPFISPTAKGSIQFEYEDKDENYLEFELLPDERIKMFFYSRDGESKTDYISAEKVSEIVNAFHKRSIR